LKRIYWDLGDKIGRFNYLNIILMHLPGSFGKMTREKIIPKYFKRCGKGISIHEGVKFRGIHEIEVGSNFSLGDDNFLQASGGLCIGNDVMFGPGVKIWTINHRFDEIELPISEQGYELKPVKIGNGVWLGANVIILPGVTLADGCVVSAGSVVGIKSYPEYAIIAGNPARVIGTRTPKPPSETNA
jgi:acetyltransferase-like isoleucine patch superfamily enzyme